MSASTDIAARNARPVGLWRPGAAVYLAGLLAAFAAGLYPAAVYPPRGVVSAPLPTLRAVVVAQLAFGLLVCPVLLLGRQHRGRRAAWLAEAAEGIVLIAAAVPFYVASAWLADAIWQDVVRSAIYVAGVWLFAWSAGHLASRSAALRPTTMLLCVLVALGLPMAWYIAAEFLGAAGQIAWLREASPLLAGWDVAAGRSGEWLARPFWAMLLWPAAAVVLRCLAQLLVRDRT